MNCNMDSPMQTSSQISDLPWKEWLVKSAVTGAIATAAGSMVFPAQSVSLAGYQVPGSVAMGLGVAGGSLVGDLTHQYVFPYIPHNEKYGKMEEAAVSLAASGLGAYVACQAVGGSGSAPFIPAVTLGAGSYLAGDYSWHHFLNKAEGGFLV
eukprot:TRINITY_DN3276_c0_g1_i1.p2 TRINITY_DN3276_c0_g1~~TRINITY_DN3276_c0_g1_i1.p2  ORF type:complete len:152 (-),score=13.36 TRINITY_DN3276_c0_g1_i1:164-619(-)